jgi:hypothetical protein
MIMDLPGYVPNAAILRDLQIPTVKEEVRFYSPQYSARLSAHPIDLIVNLMDSRQRQTGGDCEDTCQMICVSDS